MSAKTFEEWAMTATTHVIPETAWYAGQAALRAALLAERPDVARIIGELRNWADEDRPGPLSHFRRKEEKAAAAIESLAAQNAAQAEEIAKLKDALKKERSEHAKEIRDAIRDAAASASRSERYPDEPYGTY